MCFFVKYKFKLISIWNCSLAGNDINIDSYFVNNKLLLASSSKSSLLGWHKQYCTVCGIKLTGKTWFILSVLIDGLGIAIIWKWELLWQVRATKQLPIWVSFVFVLTLSFIKCFTTCMDERWFYKTLVMEVLSSYFPKSAKLSMLTFYSYLIS